MCCWNKTFSKPKSWSKVCLFLFNCESYLFKLSDAIMDWFVCYITFFYREKII